MKEILTLKCRLPFFWTNLYFTAMRTNTDDIITYPNTVLEYNTPITGTHTGFNDHQLNERLHLFLFLDRLQLSVS